MFQPNQEISNPYILQERIEAMFEREDFRYEHDYREQRFLTHDEWKEWKSRQEKTEDMAGEPHAVGEVPEVQAVRDGDDDG